MSPPTSDPVKLEVTLKYATVSEFDARFAANVASDTVFLKTPKPKPVGTVVALELHLAGGEIALAGQGPVVCAFDGASVPEGRQPGMIIALTPVDDASTKRVRAIVVKYGQGRNAVLPPGVQKPAAAASPTPARAAVAPPAAVPRPPADNLGDLMPDLDAAIQGLGAGDNIQALATPIATTPPVIVSSAVQDLMDPGPGLVLKPSGSPAVVAAAAAAAPRAPTIDPPPAVASPGADLGASSWTSELDAALGTAFDLDQALPTPPAPATSRPLPTPPAAATSRPLPAPPAPASRPLPAPPAPAAARAAPPRSLEGLFGPPQTVSTEPEGMKVPAERAFSMPPPAPAPTPMDGIPRSESAAPTEPPVDDLLAPTSREGFWLGAEPEAPPAAAPSSPEPVTAPPASAAPAVSNLAASQDNLQAPPAGSASSDATPSVWGQTAPFPATSAVEVLSTQVDFAPPELRPAISVDDEAMQAIAAGTAPADFKPAYKPEEPLPTPVVVSAPRRSANDDATLRTDSVPREEFAPAPALVGAIIEDTQPPMGVETDDAARSPVLGERHDPPEVTAPLSRAQPTEPQKTASVRARSGRALGVAAGAGAVVGLLLFLLLRLMLAEPEHVVRFRQANELVRAGDSVGAIPVYQSILVSHPDFTLAKRHLAVALALTGQREQAEALLRSYIGTSEDLADVETVKKYLGEAEPNLVE